MDKSFRKLIKLQSLEDGQKYFSIFEVVCIAKDGTKCVYQRCLSYEKALRAKSFVYERLTSLYSVCFINESLVWC